MIDIFIDNREPSTFYQLGCEMYPEYNFHFIRLNTFDIIIGKDGQIGLEIKRKGDLPSSLTDKRYKNQLKKMAEFREQHGTHCYYMIQGTYTDLIKTGRYPWLTEKIYYGMIASISENADMKIIPVDNDEQIWTAIDRLIYKYNNHEPLKSVPIIPDHGTITEKMLMCIPGLGETRAKSVAEKYKDILRLCYARTEDLQEIPGIGPVHAQNIVEGIRGRRG